MAATKTPTKPSYPSKPKRPCKECGDWGFIQRPEGDNGPLRNCPTCVEPYRGGHKVLPPPEGTKLNTWGMPVATAAKTAGPQSRLPSTKAKEDRDRQNAANYGFRPQG